MKITVITVSLNSEETIEKTIKSVIGQKMKAGVLEYIVVDGGSTDATTAILQRYDACIDKWISEPDKGIFDAMNKGISMATGDVIAFLNSDDWYEDGALAIVEKAFGTEECDCVCCDNFVIRENGQRVYFDASKWSADDVHIRMIYYHSAIFCRKEFLEKRGNFDIRYKVAADYDWFLRIVERGARIQYVHKAVFTFCYGGISSVDEVGCAREARQVALCHMKSGQDTHRERIDARLCEVVLHAADRISAHSKLTEILGGYQINILWGAGARGRQWAEWLQETGIRVEAIVDSNSSIWGDFAGQVPICSPEILGQEQCNLIITPEKYVEEIKSSLTDKLNGNIRVFELNRLCKVLVESLTDIRF